MIKILTTKDKFKATIRALHVIIDQLEKNKAKYHEWDLVQTNAYLIVLHALSRKLRSKLIILENRPSNYKFRYSIDELHAMVLVYYYRMAQFKSQLDPYSDAALNEASVPIFLRLLS